MIKALTTEVKTIKIFKLQFTIQGINITSLNLTYFCLPVGIPSLDVIVLGCGRILYTANNQQNGYVMIKEGFTLHHSLNESVENHYYTK